MIYAFAIVLTVFLGTGDATAGRIPSTYDREIAAAWAEFLPGEDWRWGKAQFYQESRLDPTAVSPVGAAGIGQFMPGTWRDVPAAIRLGIADRRIAEPSIRAGAWYMARLKAGWKAPRTIASRRRLALASYNAGMGNLIKAQNLCRGPAEYEPIVRCLPDVTGPKNAR